MPPHASSVLDVVLGAVVVVGVVVVVVSGTHVHGCATAAPHVEPAGQPPMQTGPTPLHPSSVVVVVVAPVVVVVTATQVHGCAVAALHAKPAGQPPMQSGPTPLHESSVVVVVVAGPPVVVVAEPPGTVVVVTTSVKCDTPASATAPMPGRSPELSTSRFPVAGTQKTLTSVDGCGPPSERQPAAAPVAEMLVAIGFEKAPSVRCRQTPNPVDVQSVSAVQACDGGPSNAPAVLAQKPQKTRACPGWLPRLVATLVCVPVLSAKPIGRPPRDGGFGRQSWLVGYAAPSD